MNNASCNVVKCSWIVDVTTSTRRCDAVPIKISTSRITTLSGDDTARLYVTDNSGDLFRFDPDTKQTIGSDVSVGREDFIDIVELSAVQDHQLHTCRSCQSHCRCH